MAEDIRNKFVSWSARIVKEIKEIPAKNNCPGGGNFYGVGINLALVSTSNPGPNRVGVDSVEPTGPAAKAGLQSGDVIIEVDGKVFDDGKVYLPDDVAAVIRGTEGSEVDVIAERDGKRVEFVLTREPIGVASPPSSPARKAEQAEKQQDQDVTPKRQNKSIKRSEKKGEKKRQQADGQKKMSKPEIPTLGESKSEQKKENKVTLEIKQEMHSNSVLDSLESLSLSLSEEEHKDNKDLSSSAEDADQFDDTAPRNMCCGNLIIGGGPLAQTHSMDEISEEKTADNEVSSIMNSVGDDSQWEMISERSGSAIVISFNGSMSGASFGSASPSMLKNKFIMTESTGDPYITHVVLPTDTLQGLCLAYKISATRLRMENGFSGNSLQMAPKKLKIPNNIKGVPSTKGMMIRTQDTSSKEYKLYAVVAELPSMELVEAKAYLDLSNWDLDEALRSAREDEGWSLKGGFEATSSPDIDILESPVLSAVAKPKALTAQDIYAAPPPFDGAGFELKDIKHEN